jgi:hypothetical protein
MQSIMPKQISHMPGILLKLACINEQLETILKFVYYLLVKPSQKHKHVLQFIKLLKN